MDAAPEGLAITDTAGIVAALSPPLAGPRHPDALIKILDEHVAAGSLVREVDPVTGMIVYREPSK
jgi:hypothetical protein